MKLPVLADPRLWGWLAIALAGGVLIHALSPILAPFLAGAIFAYVLNPLVGRLTGRYLPRVVAVVLVLLFTLALAVALALVIVPLFIKELRMLAERLPAFLIWLNQEAAPWLKERFAIDVQLDIATVKQLAGSILSNNQDLVAGLLGSLKIGGLALLTFFVNAMLVPVVLFFLLRDWDGILARIDDLIPRHLHVRARRFLAEIDAVLAEFLRGQLIVMLVMSVFYSAALSVASLEFALPIGVITELVEGDVYHWGSLMAGALFGSLPVAFIYSFFVEYYVSGMTGSVKE